MLFFKFLAECIGVFFINGKVGVNFVLQAQFPGIGFGGMVFPKTAVGNGEGRVFLTLFIDPFGEVTGGEVRPVVVFFSLGVAQF